MSNDSDSDSNIIPPGQPSFEILKKIDFYQMYMNGKIDGNLSYLYDTHRVIVNMRWEIFDIVYPKRLSRKKEQMKNNKKLFKLRTGDGR